MTRLIHLAIALLALSLLWPARLRAWSFASRRPERVALHAQDQALVSSTQADLDGDGDMEKLVLTDGRLSIVSAVNSMWSSPEGWNVVQADLTDLNHDGLTEATLLVWRPFKPWPIDRYLPNGGRIRDFQDAAGLSCHLILIGWQRGEFRELWAGSALADPLVSFRAADLDGDGRQELVALEGRYDNPAHAPAHALTTWEWNGFGFTLLTREPLYKKGK